MGGRNSFRESPRLPGEERATPEKIGKYEILGEVGRGAAGVVYKGRDPIIGRLVAVKTLTNRLPEDTDFLPRFHRGALQAGELQHPNIVTMFDAGEHDGTPYLAMEFLEGESLARRIALEAAGQMALPAWQKLGYTLQVCRALSYAHANGIVHRGLKPGNILVTLEGIVKVTDFGISRVTRAPAAFHGLLVGTVDYLCPEQIRGEEVDGRADIWALGVTLYELLCLQKPFRGETTSAVMFSILTEEPRPVRDLRPDLPAALDQVFRLLFRKEPYESFLARTEARRPAPSRSAAQGYRRIDPLLADLEAIWRGMPKDASGRPPRAPESAAPAPPAPMPLLPRKEAGAVSRTIGKYEVLGERGRGTLGTLYDGRDTESGRGVWIKLLHPELSQQAELLERFRREAQILGVLDHPNVIRILDHGEEGGTPYNVFEPLEGESLARLLESEAAGERAIPAAQKVSYVIQVFRALGQAHSRGIVHRDIKPANIFIVGGELAKIMDFGVARVAGSSMTSSGLLIGTVDYMSPEQIRGEEVDGRSDIFNAGTMTYELLTGQKPFSGTSMPAVMFSIVSQEPKPLQQLRPDLPPELGKVLSKALRKDPAERYQTTDELLKDLEPVWEQMK